MHFLRGKIVVFSYNHYSSESNKASRGRNKACYSLETHVGFTDEMEAAINNIGHCWAAFDSIIVSLTILDHRLAEFRFANRWSVDV